MSFGNRGKKEPNDQPLSQEDREALIRSLSAKYHRLRDEANRREQTEVRDYLTDTLPKNWPLVEEDD
jgi:hypothetical protein